MKTKLYILPFFLLLFNATYVQSQDSLSYKVYSYMQTYPVFKMSGETKEYKTDTIKQIFFDSIVVVVSDHNIIQRLNGNIVFEESNRRYFFYHKDSSTGFLYDFHAQKIRKKMSVDSFLLDTWMNKFELSTIVDTATLRFVKEEADIDKNKIYFFIAKPLVKSISDIGLEIKVSPKDRDFKGSLSKIWDKKFNGKVSMIKLKLTQPIANKKEVSPFYISYSIRELNSIPSKLLVMLDDYIRILKINDR